MYLKRLELQGFKTFAQKTVLEFVPDAGGRRGITAVVGPNGSGKSNIADALRWVMGEQSLKLLRAKKSEDVIFSGSAKRARSGFSEVMLTIENDDRKDVEFSEIAITRRLYRDGLSEYEINRQAVRLQDIILLLAQCGVGQRSYSVIGQGMVDQVLVASPTERKEFFDEAFGLRAFQLKRHSALHKLDEARKNLGQSEALLREIEPRLTTLNRQMKRLQERETIEIELRTLERAYYGRGWHDLSATLRLSQEQAKKSREEQTASEAAAKKLEVQLAALEKAAPVSQGFRELRQSLDTSMKQREELRERQLQLELKRARAEVQTAQPAAALPFSQVIEKIELWQRKQEELEKLIQKPEVEIKSVRQLVSGLIDLGRELLAKLKFPVTPKAPPKNQALDQETAEITQALERIARDVKEVELKLENWNKEEEGQRKHIFDLQRQLNQKRQEAQVAERIASEAAVELARVETRRDGFLIELKQYAPHLERELDSLAIAAKKMEVGLDATARLQKLRSQLEWIGGIDPETVSEYETTSQRHTFLKQQVEDLQKSIGGLELVIAELDTTIRERSETAFHKLDREFNVFFKKLFNGGEAKLSEVAAEPETDEEGNVIEEEKDKVFSGIEIHANPPGKRSKAIALLSGGERALTSIALICAIMATNPSPFVVLDEVDAALDEANSRKFAEIINSLADKTQFIVVTHNRATMMRAHILYGVTMGVDGVSQLLSVKLEEVEKMRQRA